MIQELVRSKQGVAVWGLGYLGYTAMLDLQERGFTVQAYDPQAWVRDLFRTQRYPNAQMMAMWSETGHIPPLRYEQAVLRDTPVDLFREAGAHIIAVPMGVTAGENELLKITRHFLDNIEAIRRNPQLVIFASAYVPGFIDTHFVNPLAEAGVAVGRDLMVCTAFRSDWVYEELRAKCSRRVAGADSPASAATARDFFAATGQECVEAGSIREAEVLENARRAFRFLTTGFVNQLALCYESVNMKRLATLLVQNVDLADCLPNMGAGGNREPFAVQHLLEGADQPKYFTTLSESQATNFALPIHYAHHLIRNGITRVAVLGMTFFSNRRDITLSPSISFSSYLHDHGVKVLVHDDIYPWDDIAAILPQAECCPLEKALGESEAVVLMTNHKSYRALSEKRLSELLGPQARIVMDNVGLWAGYRLPAGVEYHEVGDGTLNVLG